VDNPSLAKDLVAVTLRNDKLSFTEALTLDRYSLVALDLDGTTLSPEGVVTARTRAAIHALVKVGVRVCFATGRSFPESRQILSQIEHYDLAVFVGGPMVVDTATGQTVVRQHMKTALAVELVKFFQSRGQPACALQDRTAAGFDYLITADVPLHESLAHWLVVTDAVCKYLPAMALAEADHSNTLRVGVVVELATATWLQRELDAAFGERIVQHMIVPTQTRTKVAGVLEVFDPAVSKWTGIQQVARRHGIADEAVIAVGDDFNDLAMLRNAGLGVAMGNAVPAAKAVAGRVIESNAADGLAKFLEDIVRARAEKPGSVTPENEVCDPARGTTRELAANRVCRDGSTNIDSP